ncbi:MAG: GIY-YIG nuclease family protein [Bacillota bacterium]|nr:GIY-YIG nuclease family protein [Bacillota bacterium]
MDKLRRKELLEEYKQIKTYMGVVKITNVKNGKIFLAAFPNLKNIWTRIEGQLNMGRHTNSKLQKDWNEYGADAFIFEILEEKKTDDMIDVAFEAKLLLKNWLIKLQPFDECGYNKRPDNIE